MLKNGAVVSGGVQSFVTHGSASNNVNPDLPFTFTFPINTTPVNSSGIEARWNGTASAAGSYPFYGVFQRFVRSNSNSGWGVQQFYACGGSHTGDADTWITNLGYTKNGNYFKCLSQYARAGDYSHNVLVWIVLGANDAGASRTKAQFKASVQNIIARTKYAWSTTCGYSASKLAFVIQVDHQRTLTLDDQEQYRIAAMEIAAEDTSGLVASIDLNQCVSYSTLSKNFASSAIPTYAGNTSDSDRAHLLVTSSTVDSYTSVAYMVGNLLDGSSSILSDHISTPVFNSGQLRMRTGLVQNLSYKLGV
jgi:hypothetical protein